MAEFSPPGPGHWELDRSHYPGGTTPISQWAMEHAMEAGLGQVFAEIGMPASGIRARFVNGFMYTRLIPIVGGEGPPRKPPPAPLLKILARLHPELRRRERTARASLENPAARDVARRWEHEIGPELTRTNLTFQAVDVASISDDELQAHVSALLGHLYEQFELHFWLHGHDLGPVARYVHQTVGWGIEPASALRALGGASPSTSAPVETLVAIREAVEASGQNVRTLDDIRSVSAEAARLLDDYLATHGLLLATGYDLTSRTLLELPQLVVDGVLHAEPITQVDHASIAAELREQVPATERARFDELLDDARSIMDMRDNQGPLTVEWPCGLLRRALLEAGRRLVDRGALDEPDDAVELTVDEARSLFSGGIDRDTVRARADSRRAHAELTPPSGLGDPEPAPPPNALPGSLGELVDIVNAAMEHMGMGPPPPDAEPLVGVGIGTEPYVGRARSASSPEEAIETMEPGDVLVVRATSPAFNAVLAVAGAVVTADGGPMSHAAVLARELGIAGVIGAPGALDIPDGASVEVDPAAGRVTVLPA